MESMGALIIGLLAHTLHSDQYYEKVPVEKTYSLCNAMMTSSLLEVCDLPPGHLVIFSSSLRRNSASGLGVEFSFLLEIYLQILCLEMIVHLILLIIQHRGNRRKSVTKSPSTTVMVVTISSLYIPLKL